MAIEQIRSTNAALREAAILYLLDGEPTLRRAVASELLARAASLSPESLRRLIGMRNWCPEKERPALDAIIRAVRAKGIDCAAWPQGGAGTVYASGIDGSGAQGFLIVSPVGRRCRSPQFYSRMASAMPGRRRRRPNEKSNRRSRWPRGKHR